MINDQQSGATRTSSICGTVCDTAADAPSTPSQNQPAISAAISEVVETKSPPSPSAQPSIASLQKDVAAVVAQQKLMMEQQKELMTQLGQPMVPPRKDFFDMAAAIAPILSGTIIAVGGAYFTTVYNQQQLKLQEIQTIEKFIPHLTGDEKSKKAAILAISSLTDTKLASRIAALYASAGTVSALETMAQQGNQGDRKIASGALARALDTMAANFSDEKRYQDAITTYKRALIVREQTYGAQSPHVVPSLVRLADLYRLHGDYALAESMLKRAIEVQRKAFGSDSAECIAALKQLQALYILQGAESSANALGTQIAECEARLRTQGKPAHDSAPLDDEDAPVTPVIEEVNQGVENAGTTEPPVPATTVDKSAAPSHSPPVHGAAAASETTSVESDSTKLR